MVGSAEDAFDVVIPSLPGHGLSGKPTTTGWGADRIARAWNELMKRLGYTRYVAQGGDWGAVVVELMGVQAPPELLAIHTNMPGIFPADIEAAFSGRPRLSGLSADEKVAYERLQFVYKRESPTGSRWACGRRRCTESRTHPSAWRLISSITTRAAMRSSRASSTDSPKASRATTSSTTSRYLVDEHGGFWRPSLLGVLGQGYFNAKGVSIPGCRERLS